MKKIITFLLIVLLMAGCMNQGSNSEKEPEKTQPPETEPPETQPPETEPPKTELSVTYQFAPYRAIPVTFTGDVALYPFEPENMEKFRLSPEQESFLLQNGFVVVPAYYDQFFTVYQDCKKQNIPIFVTTDSLLHTYHILYDYTLRLIETEHFSEDTLQLTKTMVTISLQYYNETNDEAALKNVAYFCVAGKLLDDSFDIPSDVKDMVSQELALIQEHAGFFESPIFGYKEDYSQYVPRGHYTRSELLEKYFKAMMWYGRIMFRVKSAEETKQALYIVKGIQDTHTLDLWDKIYQPTVFFVGKTDDLNIYEYSALADEIYGSGYTIQDLQDIKTLEKFREKARELRDPRIVGTWVKDYEDTTEETKSFRFMGQRFIPDSYMFQQLVYDKVGTASDPRIFPKGLDIMAVLGSERALTHLEPEFQYQNYGSQMNSLREEFSDLDISVWTQNLYWMWLYALKPLLQERTEKYPVFMQSDAWTDKQLNTALGSWAELRHDTILYAKQSYTIEATAIPYQPELTTGYVEPCPYVYARLAALTRMMRTGLQERDLLLPEYSQKLQILENVLLKLKTISEKELSGEVLTQEEYTLIWDIGDTLESLVTFETAVETETDENLAIVADVHTDVNTQQVLEEGVGSVFLIFAVVNVDGTIIVTEGGVFSYYEFTHPISDRLTDEQWQSMEKPPLPEWTSSFIIE